MDQNEMNMPCCSKGPNNHRRRERCKYWSKGMWSVFSSLIIPQDSVSVENALYTDPRITEVAAIGVPDDRLGELVAAVVVAKPAFKGQLVEEELISLARERFVLFILHAIQICLVLINHRNSLPKFAVPVMVMIRNEPFGAFVRDDVL
jgi:hypothetical protein